MFDKVMLLSEGRVVFLGPPAQLVPYFSSIGIQFPPFVNPTDHLRMC